MVNMTMTLGEFAKSSAQSSLASLSKGGWSSVTTSLAIEDAGRCICVNAVSLGVIHTPLHPVEAWSVSWLASRRTDRHDR